MCFLLCPEITRWSTSCTLARRVARSTLLAFQLQFCMQSLPLLADLLEETRQLHVQAERRERGTTTFATRLLKVYFLDPVTLLLGRYRTWNQYEGGLTSSRGWNFTAQGWWDVSGMDLQRLVEDAICVSGSAWHDPGWVHRTIEPLLR